MFSGVPSHLGGRATETEWAQHRTATILTGTLCISRWTTVALVGQYVARSMQCDPSRHYVTVHKSGIDRRDKRVTHELLYFCTVSTVASHAIEEVPDTVRSVERFRRIRPV